MSNDDASNNQILAALPPAERDLLLTHATHVVLSAGEILMRSGDPISLVYFPTTGLISIVGALRSGHQMAVAATGREGLVGMGAVLDVWRTRYSLIVQVDSTGYQMPADDFRRVFEQSSFVRRLTLAYIGRKLNEIATSACCMRFHSHHQRLARWLLVATDKSGHPSLSLTHDSIAQMVGGPRHAVTAALKELRTSGAIEYARCHVDIRDRAALIARACECYAATSPFSPAD